VCDPAPPPYTGDPSIRIPRAQETRGGPVGVYDLCWEQRPSDLPSGTVEWTMTCGTDILPDTDESVVSAIITCHSVGKPQAKDCRWRIDLRTCFFTKALTVSGSKQLPSRCSTCLERISGPTAYVCQRCSEPRRSLCPNCHQALQRDPGRHRGHAIAMVSLEP
jgi:hypothetical protein